ncbi:hypothetical protein ACWEVD_30335 [Nocardia thailandica]|uniref:Secreted protein n=1 Tax=Nocardia thailandica TaxID=257275 RepID=A0ABW6PHI0_9NOCA|nr:hypothetical protein [Nocardia thailandica]
MRRTVLTGVLVAAMLGGAGGAAGAEAAVEGVAATGSSQSGTALPPMDSPLFWLMAIRNTLLCDLVGSGSGSTCPFGG